MRSGEGLKGETGALLSWGLGLEGQKQQLGQCQAVGKEAIGGVQSTSWVFLTLRAGGIRTPLLVALVRVLGFMSSKRMCWKATKNCQEEARPDLENGQEASAKKPEGQLSSDGNNLRCCHGDVLPRCVAGHKGPLASHNGEGVLGGAQSVPVRRALVCPESGD